MVRVATAQDPESVPNVCGGIAANTPTNVGVSFLGQKKEADRPEEEGRQEGCGERIRSGRKAVAKGGEHEPRQRPSSPQPQRH